MKKLGILMMLIMLGLSGPRSRASEGPARTIEVVARRFAFTPAEITVKRGETIDLKVTSEDVPHALVVKALHIRVEVSRSHPGEVTFVPTQTGDFQGRCGRFCGSGHGRMVFTIHVTD
jgi:cytochrome c oxidase subunit 2